MEIISCFDSENQAKLIEKIADCDWRAALFWAELLQEGTFNETLGGWGDDQRVLYKCLEAS